MTANYTIETSRNFPRFTTYQKLLLHDGDYIAGGFAKNVFDDTKPRDLDMYFETQTNQEDTLKRMLDSGWERTFTSDNAVGVSKDELHVDLVTRMYLPAEETLEQFDFTVTKFAYRRRDAADGTEFEAVFHRDFFEHYATKRLVIDGSLPLPINTFNRMLKYTRYGYTLCHESKIRLLTAIRDWQPRDKDSEEDELAADLARSMEESMD